MDVTVEDLSAVKKKLLIEIPQEEVVRELDQAYNTLKKKAKIKGFRPGKAPRSVLERLYKKDVQADVCSRLIQESFTDAIRKTEIKILGVPEIDPPKLDGKEPYRYEAMVEVSPEIEDIDFKGLNLKRNLYEVSEEEIETQIKLLQKNLAYHKPIGEDRPVQENDFVLIDYEGFRDGEPFSETQKTENYTLKIGDGQILKAFDEQLVGMKTGETREVRATFPEDYFNKKLANLEIAFQVSLKGIREETLPEIDDELAKKLGKYETLDELKTAIRYNLDQGYTKRKEQELNEQIFTALIERKDFEVPEILINSELDAIIEDIERSFSYHNQSMEDAGLTREILSEKYRDIAQKQVKRYLVLKKLIEQEGLALSDEDLEKGFQEMSESVGQPIEEIRNYYEQNQDKLKYFKHTLLEKKVIKLIIDSSNIQDVVPEKQPDE